MSLSKNSVFGNVAFKDVEVRGNGRSVKFEVRNDDVTGLNLSNITKLGSIDVSVHLPLLDLYSVGVIGSFDKYLDLGKDVFPHLKVVNNEKNIKIIYLERIMNKEGKIEQVKVIFDANLPKILSLNGLIYRVRRHDFNSKRCFRCSLYGHSSDSCNRKLFCAFCGLNHFLAKCPTKQNKGVAQVNVIILKAQKLLKTKNK